MDTHISASPVRAGNDSPLTSLRGLVRFLYTHNPFYVISAWLVFTGLRMSFKTQDRTFDTWGLMVGLGGYTLLLAATAYVLIRWGKVWDDVRTMLLLIVLIFLGMAVTFDDRLADDHQLGVWWYLGGLAFAAAVSEGLLRGLRISLPRLFRGPYYLLLGLYFLYPVALSPRLDEPDSLALQWGLFGFSSLAGVASLSLLPAIRRGPSYVDNNGTPWAWPWFPWVLFGLLAWGVCVRSYYLCVSLHFVAGTTSIFGPYFLVPFVLCIGLLLLEAGIVSKSRATQIIALATPVVAICLAAIGHRSDAVFVEFRELVATTLHGSPLYLSVCAAIAFYCIAMMRRVRFAPEMFTAAWLLLAFVNRQTYGPLFGQPEAIPFAAAGLILLVLGLRCCDSHRFLIGATSLAGGLFSAVQHELTPHYQLLLAIHLGLAVALLVGAIFEDGLAKLLQRTGAGTLLLLSATATFGEPWLREIPTQALYLYPWACMALAVAYGFTFNRLFYSVAAISFAGCVGFGLWHVYGIARRHIVGLDHIAIGLLFFLIAAVISMMKAGMTAKRISDRFRRLLKYVT